MGLSKVNSGLQGLLLKIFGEEKRELVILSLSWRKLVGDYLAERSYIVKLNDSTLFIGVANSVILQELILIRDDLKQRINRLLKNRVREIIFTVRDDAKRD